MNVRSQKSIVLLSRLGPILLHVLGVFNFLPTLAKLSNSTPFLTNDYSLHAYHGYLTLELWEKSGKAWGYDPHFMAGYPAAAVTDMDFKLGEIFVTLFSFLDPAVTMKSYVCLTFFLFPLLLLMTAKNFGFRSGATTLYMVLGIIYWWFSPFRDYIYYGMSSFTFASYLSIFAFSCLYRFIETHRIQDLIRLSVVSSLSFLCHILSPVLITVPALILLVIKRTHLTKLRIAQLGLFLLFVIATNYYWLAPFFSFHEELISPAHFYLTEDPFRFFQDYAVLVYGGALVGGNFLALFIMISGIGGLYLWHRSGDERFYPVAIGAAFLLLLAYGGSFVAFTRQFEPMRFKGPLNLFLLLPASYFLLYSRLRILTAGMSMIVLISLAPTLHAEIEHPRSIVSSLNDPMKRLVSWIKQETSSDARIMIEESAYESGNQYYDTFLIALLPKLTQREFIGGPYPYLGLRHGFAKFHASTLFGKQIGKFSPNRLKRYLDLYNVGWIVCFHPKSVLYFDGQPDYFLSRGKIDRFHLYEVNRKPSFILKGEGRVRSELNTIFVEEFEGDELVLKYHWLKTFKTTPQVHIEPIFLLKDPVPFIRIKNPPSSLVIYNGY